jgi:Cu/Ag efflux protein CusF
MKKVLRVLGVALITLAFGGLSFAASSSIGTAGDPSQTPEAAAKREGVKKEGSSTSPKPKSTTTTGEVTAVDSKAGMLTVKTKDKDLNLNASSKAKSALGKVKVGDMVKVTYTEQDGKMTASSVSVQKGKKMAGDAGGKPSSSIGTAGDPSQRPDVAAKREGVKKDK